MSNTIYIYDSIYGVGQRFIHFPQMINVLEVNKFVNMIFTRAYMEWANSKHPTDFPTTI